MTFEWDEIKAKTNILKHQVSFDEAATVFADEHAILFDDPDHSEQEERFILLGMSEQARMLIVCHCVRNQDTIRIISARKATKNEQAEYVRFNGR